MLKYASANFRTDLFPLGGSIQIEISHLKYSSILYSFKAPDYLIIGLPVQGGQVKYVENDTDVIFRFVDSGNAYGAQSYVLNSYTSPLPMMMIAYPETIESISVRTSDRIDTCLPAVFTSRNKKSITGAVTNLSLGGVRFHYAGSAPVLGETGRLEMKLPELDAPVSVSGTVKNSDPEESDDGICFDQVVEDKSSPLHQYYTACKNMMPS